MSTTTEAVDQVFKVTLDGIIYIFRLIEIGAPAAAHGLSFLKSKTEDWMQDRWNRSTGNMAPAKMLRQKQGIAYYMVLDSDIEKFSEAAKNTTLKYSYFSPITVEGGKSVREVIIPRDQVQLMNHVINLSGTGIVKQAVAEQADIAPEHEGRQQREAVPNAVNNRAWAESLHEAIRQRASNENVTQETPSVNPPRADRNSSQEVPSAFASSTTGIRNESLSERDLAKVNAAAERPSVREKVESFANEAATPPLERAVEQSITNS